MLSKFFCYACVFFCIPALACVFFCPKPTNSLQKNTSFTNVCPLLRISSGFLFVKCASRQARVSLSSISGQSNCPLIYCIIAELHFQMPSFRHFIRSLYPSLYPSFYPSLYLSLYPSLYLSLYTLLFPSLFCMVFCACLFLRASLSMCLFGDISFCHVSFLVYPTFACVF